MKIENTRTGKSFEIPDWMIILNYYLSYSFPIAIILYVFQCISLELALVPLAYYLLLLASVLFGFKWIGCSWRETGEFLEVWYRHLKKLSSKEEEDDTDD